MYIALKNIIILSMVFTEQIQCLSNLHYQIILIQFGFYIESIDHYVNPYEFFK